MRHAGSSLAQTIPAQAPQRLAKRITAAVRSTQQDDLPRVVIRMAWNTNPSQFRSDFENLRVSIGDIQKRKILRHAERQLVIPKRAPQLPSHLRVVGKSSRPL